MQGHLTLDIPLDHDEAGKTGVVVDFSTVGATLKMPSPKLDMSEVKGDFRFDLAKGLSAPAVQARVLGSAVRGRIVAEGRGDARTRLLLNGQVAVKSLSDWLGAGQRPLPVSGRLPFPGSATSRSTFPSAVRDRRRTCMWMGPSTVT